MAIPSTLCYATGVRVFSAHYSYFHDIIKATTKLVTFFNRSQIVAFFLLQAQRVHWVCISHSPAFLASAGLTYPLCFASGFHIMYAHSTGCWLSHCRPPYCNPHWFSRAIQGTAVGQLSLDLFIYLQPEPGACVINVSALLLPDVRAPHVLPVPCLHVCSVVDHLLWASSCCTSRAEPEPERVLLKRYSYRLGVLEPSHTQHPPAHGPQQSSKIIYIPLIYNIK